MAASGTGVAVGPFTLSVVDGDVRDVRVSDVPVVQHVYAAVRGPEWDTAGVEPVLVRTGVAGGVLEHRVEAVHRLPAGTVDSRLDVRGGPGGRLEWNLRLRPRDDLLVNRAGLAVLLPDRSVAGRPYRGVLPSGAAVAGRLPFAVGPQRIADGVLHGLFPAVRTLAVELAGLTVELAIEGDEVEGAELELEDQRNWTETSFKAYTRSLRRPRPYRLAAGRTVRQRVTVEVREVGPAARSRRGRPDPVLRAPAVLRLRRPPVGAELPPGPLPGSDVVAALAAVGLDHLHVDARAEPDRVGAAAGLAAALGAGLELAVEDAGPPPPLPPGSAPLHRVLVSRDGAPPPAGLDERHGAAYGARVPLHAAAVADFAALNRTFEAHVPVRAAFGASPQVHLTDDRTVLESPRGLHAAVCSARHAGVRHVVAAPVTLRPRAATPGAQPAADDRLDGPLGAAWAAASLIWLTAAGAGAVTLLATHGPAGLVAVDAAGPRSRPVAAVVAALLAVPVGTPAAVVPEPGGGPVLAAVFAAAPARRWLVVNTSGAPRRATVAAGPARLHRLDPDGAWRSADGARTAAGELVVPLPPHGVALIDEKAAG